MKIVRTVIGSSPTPNPQVLDRIPSPLGSVLGLSPYHQLRPLNRVRLSFLNVAARPPRRSKLPDRCPYLFIGDLAKIGEVGIDTTGFRDRSGCWCLHNFHLEAAADLGENLA